MRMIQDRKDLAAARKERIAMGIADRESLVCNQVWRDQLRLEALARDDDSSDSMCGATNKLRLHAQVLCSINHWDEM